MAKELLEGLHENLWSSLRHIFNTDRVMLGVAYLVNFSAFVLLLALLPEQVTSSLIAIACLALLNGLLFLSLRNSKTEVLATIETLSQMYQDNELNKYFNSDKAAYYTLRYNLWLLLIPGLMAFAIVIALAIEYVT
ncbi:MAG: hypothetical protein PVJ68_18280 [Candidatus Thiodiazotropha sp.]